MVLLRVSCHFHNLLVCCSLHTSKFIGLMGYENLLKIFIFPLNMNKIFAPVRNKELIGVIVRTYAFKSDLKIKWVRPEKIPSFKPEKSGDLSAMPKIDKSQYLLEFRYVDFYLNLNIKINLC